MVTMATTVEYGGLPISAETFSVDVRAGRSRDADEFSPSTGTILLHNKTRNFDPSFFATPNYLLLESGDYLLLESGDRIVLEQGAQASGDYGVISLGTDVVVKDGAVTVFTGHVEDTDNEYGRANRNSATFILGDTLTSLASSSFQTEWQTTDNQLSGARLAEIIDRSGVDGLTVSLDAGTIRLQGNLVAVGTNILQEAQLVSRTEYGKLYIDRAGFLQFRDRYTFPSPTAAADFDDTNTNFQFSGAGVGVGSELRAWSWTVQRLGGEAKTALSAASPPPKLGRRGGSDSGLLFRGDMYSESLAEFKAEKYSNPDAVISSLKVKLHGISDVDDRATIAALEINDTVTLSWTPTGEGAPVSQTLVIEGWAYSADHTGRAEMTFQLSSYPETNYFTWDVSSFDTGVPYGF